MNRYAIQNSLQMAKKMGLSSMELHLGTTVHHVPTDATGEAMVEQLVGKREDAKYRIPEMTLDCYRK